MNNVTHSVEKGLPFPVPILSGRGVRRGRGVFRRAVRGFFSFLLGLLFLGEAPSMAQLTGNPLRQAITMQASQVDGPPPDGPAEYLSLADHNSPKQEREATAMGGQPCTDFTGVWNGSGNTWTATTFSGVGVTITLQADPGAEWRTHGSDYMNTIDAWSEPGVQGYNSFELSFIWDTDTEGSYTPAADDASTGTITIRFDRPVLNPVLHIDRLGGVGGGNPNSSEWTLLTPGASMTRLAGVDHFVAEPQRFYRSLAGGETDGSQSSLNTNEGTAAGSVGFEGMFNELKFSLTGIGLEGVGADGIELMMCGNNSSFDFGDLPAPYLSTVADRGPSHEIAGGGATHYLGAAPDAENDAQPTTAADGDDSNNSADEDGITWPTMSRGGTYLITADVTGDGGYLQGWVDWNGDGDFADTVDGESERIATDLPDGDSDGTIEVPVTVPASATFGQTYARFRWSTVQGLDETTYARDGEVEDYAVTLSAALRGTVFEDITGDALNDGDNTLNDGTGDQQGVGNARVLLFRDGGDGRPDGNDDAFMESTTTGANGEYSFGSLPPFTTYWVAVDSRSGDLSNGTTWAEQTYATAGGYCSDGSGNAPEKTAAGPCYGGRGGGQSDLLPAAPTGTDLAGAEHLIKAEISQAETTDKNFGFSYNVVTDVRDGDDDGGAGRSIQGSLRQFIRNANAIGGANAMRFVPAVPLNQDNWWQIALDNELSPITGPQTTIDGTAYTLNDGVTIRDTNTGSEGTGGTVGVDELAFETFLHKELEITFTSESNLLRINSSGNVTIQNLALYNSYDAITVVNTTGGSISNNYVGVKADGSDPGGNARVKNGIQFDGSSSSTLTIDNNYIGFSHQNGISSGNSNVNVILEKNEIFNSGLSNNASDGIDVVGSWTVTQNLLRDNGNPDSSPENGGAGLELGRGSGTSTDNIIRNNTMRGNSMTGLNILIHIRNTTIEKNIITNNGTGIKLSNRGGGGDNQSIQITRNSIYKNNGLGIDLVTDPNNNGQADGVTPNDGITSSATEEPNIGMDYPVFTTASYETGTLHVEGYVGRAGSPISGAHAIELFKADDDGNNSGAVETGDSQSVPHGEGQTYLQSFTTNSEGTFVADLATADVAPGDIITATATDPDGNTSEFSANSEVHPPGISVTGTVYSDANHSGTRELGEGGVAGVTVVLRDTGAGTCRSVGTDGGGNYRFEAVANGKYEIVEAAGESTPAPVSCPPADTDPPGYVSTTSNILRMSVTGAPVTEQNFGDFNGSTLTGSVFSDDGAGSGTANDGLQNGGEVGVANSVVRLTDSSGNTIYEQTQSSGDGSYTLWIPDGLSGSSLRVEETNVDNYVSTGGDAGTSGGSYDRGTDAATFTPASGAVYNEVNFGDVQNNSFNTDGQQNTTAGTTVFFPHTFTARTTGELMFRTTHAANPVNTGWSQVIYQDDNCNGTIESGEQIADTPIAVTAGQQICIVVRANTPDGAPAGSSNAVTVTADFRYSNASPALSGQYLRVDLVKVTDASGSGLKLTKQVDREQALPGQTLTYTIRYTNNSSEPLSGLEIIDSTPAYTRFASASCGTPLSENLTNCTIDAPPPGQTGTISWGFTGRLAPGSSGIITYQVTIKE